MTEAQYERYELLYRTAMIQRGFRGLGNTMIPPAGVPDEHIAVLTAEAIAEAKERLLLTSNHEFPWWHEQNPWNDHILYVPQIELASCLLSIGRDFTTFQDQPIAYEVRHALHHWNQYGDKLDAYILTGPVLTAGVRYGPEGGDYLSPGFSTPKLIGLLHSYLPSKKRRG